MGNRKNTIQDRRRVTVADTIRMTVWTDRHYTLGAGPSASAALFSPDGKHFLVLVRRGNLERDTNEDSIVLYQRRDSSKSPEPSVVVTMDSSTNREAIKHVQWLEDSKTVVFLGEKAHEQPALYRLDIETREIAKLTNHPTPITAYDISSDGGRIVYLADPPLKNILNTNDTRRDGVVISNQSPDQLLAGDCEDNRQPYARGEELFVQLRGQAPVRIPTHDFLTDFDPPSVSPNGRYAILAAYVAAIPEFWLQYKNTQLHPYMLWPLKPGTPSQIKRYMLLDTETGEFKPLLNTPMPWSNAAFVWARNGSSLVVSGAYLPLDAPDPGEREVRRKELFVIEVQIPSGTITKITDKPLKVTCWHRITGGVLLESSDSLPDRVRAVYEKEDGLWQEVPFTPEDWANQDPLAVTLEEDMNTPPRIYTSDPGTGHKSLLLDLNPQFRDLVFAKVEAVSWKATDGHEVMGGLYLPPDYVSGKRYPVVIQTHGFRQDRFWIDGPWHSAFAAQPLAAVGVVVLQVGYSKDPNDDARYSDTAEEGPRHMAAYEGAIDYLDARGVIDRNRVGIIGFSRTVFRVAYTLTHSKYRFVAASLADGFDGGYVNYILWGGTSSTLVNGGMPFGSTAISWLRNSPGFNLDKVQAAVRVEEYGRGSFLGGWEWFSGLSLLDKPVDFIWLPCGTHMLVKPWERLASQQGNVDWFRFWLKDEEDTDPGKIEEYKRWRDLRKVSERNRQDLGGTAFEVTRYVFAP